MDNTGGLGSLDFESQVFAFRRFDEARQLELESVAKQFSEMKTALRQVGDQQIA